MSRGGNDFLLIFCRMISEKSGMQTILQKVFGKLDLSLRTVSVGVFPAHRERRSGSCREKEILSFLLMFCSKFLKNQTFHV